MGSPCGHWRTPCQLRNALRTQLILLVHHPAIGILRRARAQQFDSVAAFALIVLTLISCSGDRDNTAQAKTASHSVAGSIQLPSIAYTPGRLASMGSIAGTVELDGDA